MISNEAVEAAVREVDRFVYKPPADELPSIEGHKNALMRAVLEAAAPYMLFAPEGVSEAEIVRHMTHEEWRGCRIENYRWKFKIPEALQGSEWDWSYASHWSTPAAHEEAEALVSVKDAERALLSALSSERERAADYKQAFETADRLLGNAQARADQAEFLLALALECARTKAAREAAMFDLADAAEARAQRRDRGAVRPEDAGRGRTAGEAGMNRVLRPNYRRAGPPAGTLSA